ncbi:MAG: hypothetical protein IPL83_06735 [Bdellovibrionales bacterium]|nr:hypothetical protein [Bdellovibrionales bacterium]
MSIRTIKTVVASAGLMMVSLGCSEFKVSKSKLESFPSNISSDKGKMSQTDIALSAVTQVLADLQLSQIDGLMASQEMRQLAFQGENDGWGGAAAENSLQASQGSGGWGGGGDANDRTNPKDTFKIERDCDLGGKVSSTFKAKNINTNGLAAFAEATTTPMQTQTLELTQDFTQCRFSDTSHSIYVVSGQLKIPVQATSSGVFTVKKTVFGLSSNGGGEVSGRLKITLSDIETVNCELRVGAEAVTATGEVQRAQRKGIISLQSAFSGQVCGEETQTDTVSAKVTF